MSFFRVLMACLLLKTIVPSINVHAQTSGCGGTYSNLSGTISSPNYPSNYNSNLTCSYYIQISPPNYVNITFISFLTEACCDTLQIACASDSTIPARTFSGAAVPLPLSIMSCSNVSLHFSSDMSVNFEGFSLRYNIYSACGETYTSMSGIISSPNYNPDYSGHLNCSYYIQIPPPNSINITFISFYTDSCCGYLQVICVGGSTKPVQRFYGTDLPPFLSISSCNTVQLLFYVDGSLAGQAFSLRYDIGNGLQGGLTMKPMNVYVRNTLTEPIVLSCSSRAIQPDAYPWWTYISNDSPNVETLTTSNCVVSSSLKFLNSTYFSTARQNSTGICNLTISPSYLNSAAGFYTCTDATLDYAGALVTYIVPSFTVGDLSSPTEEFVRADHISVTCGVQVVQTAPSFLQLVPSIYIYSGDNQHLILACNMTASFIVLPYTEVLLSYVCNINFTFSRDIPTGYATNLPGNISLVTPPRQVLYWPEETRMVIQGDNNGRVVANGSLTCFVPANPPATYQWTTKEYGFQREGPTVAVSHNGTYTCTANNIIRGIAYEASKSINLTVIDGDQPLPCTEKSGPEDKLNSGVVLRSAVLLLLASTIVALVCLCK